MRFSKTAALLAAALLVTMGIGGAFAGPAQHDDHAHANATEDPGPAENASEQAHAIHAVIEQYLSGELDAESLGAAVSDVAAGDDVAESDDADDEAETNESDDADDDSEPAENESAANETAQESPESAEDDEADEERTNEGDERDEAEEDRADPEQDDNQ